MKTACGNTLAAAFAKAGLAAIVRAVLQAAVSPYVKAGASDALFLMRSLRIAEA